MLNYIGTSRGFIQEGKFVYNNCYTGFLNHIINKLYFVQTLILQVIDAIYSTYNILFVIIQTGLYFVVEVPLFGKTKWFNLANSEGDLKNKMYIRIYAIMIIVHTHINKLIQFFFIEVS